MLPMEPTDGADAELTQSYTEIIIIIFIFFFIFFFAGIFFAFFRSTLITFAKLNRRTR